MRLAVCDERWEIVKNVLVSVKRQMVQHGGGSVVHKAYKALVPSYQALHLYYWDIGSVKFPTGVKLVCFRGFTHAMYCLPLSPHWLNRIMGITLIWCFTTDI